MNNALSQFIQVLKRVPLFQGLKPDEAFLLLKSCDLIATLSDRLRHANGEITHLQKLIADIGEGQTLPPDPAE